MKRLHFTLFSFSLLVSIKLISQSIKLETNKIEAVNVSMSIEKIKNKDVLKVIKDSSIKNFDEPTYVKLKEIDFKNWIIEVNVLSKILPNAPSLSRGFIGIAFRINNNNSKFECIYLRPANGRDTSQIRRNHSIQYFSFPEFQFERLRKEASGEYESYADIGLNEWIKLKIVVKDSQAKLFLNENRQPSLIVNDLKHGDNNSGSIGLWVDVGTEGFFSNLKIYK
jgi:hypothetical protein